jgi:hypothetical protein
MPSSKWSFMQAMHRHIAERQFLASGVGLAGQPKFFFETFPITVLMEIFAYVPTNELLEFLDSDPVFQYRFFGTPRPESLRGLVVLEPTADVMLLMLEREFGLTNDVTKAQCMQPLREETTKAFAKWRLAVRDGVAEVKAVLEKLLTSPMDAYLQPGWSLAGGVVFRIDPETSILQYASLIETFGDKIGWRSVVCAEAHAIAVGRPNQGTYVSAFIRGVAVEFAGPRHSCFIVDSNGKSANDGAVFLPSLYAQERNYPVDFSLIQRKIVYEDYEAALAVEHEGGLDMTVRLYRMRVDAADGVQQAFLPRPSFTRTTDFSIMQTEVLFASRIDRAWLSERLAVCVVWREKRVVGELHVETEAPATFRKPPSRDATYVDSYSFGVIRAVDTNTLERVSFMTNEFTLFPNAQTSSRNFTQTWSASGSTLRCDAVCSSGNVSERRIMIISLETGKIKFARYSLGRLPGSWTANRVDLLHVPTTGFYQQGTAGFATKM